jgi:predicted AlkP superfamily phosphohydrolase/phosphomutase
MPTKLLIVGLDSVEPELMAKWTRQGALPNLAALVHKGQDTALENYAGFGNGAYWPSVNTGTDPSVHGRYFRKQVMPADYAVRPFVDDVDMQALPFWADCEREGMRVAVLDPVVTRMAGLQHGLELTRWIVHGRTGDPASVPPERVHELIARYGDDPLAGNADAEVAEGMSHQEICRLSAARIGIKREACEELLQAQDWDVFYVTFSDGHDVGHLCWHLHEAHEAGTAEDGEDPLLQCYRNLDSALGQLMAHVAPGGQSFVITGPGMESNVTANPLLGEILRRLEGRPQQSWIARLSALAKGALRSQRLPRPLRERLGRAKNLAKSAANRAVARRFYAVPHNHNAGAVRIGVAGREPNGAVAPGDDYDRLCDSLTADLLAIRDAAGERPLVSEVIKPHSLFSGPRVAGLPDLMVIWNRDADVRKLSSPKIGSLEGERHGYRSGDHSSRGALISDRAFALPHAPPLKPEMVASILVEAARRATDADADADVSIAPAHAVG